MSTGDPSELYEQPETTTQGLDDAESQDGSEYNFPANEDLDDTLEWMNIFVPVGGRQRSGGSASHSDASVDDLAQRNRHDSMYGVPEDTDLAQRNRHDSMYEKPDSEDQSFDENLTPGFGVDDFQHVHPDIRMSDLNAPVVLAQHLANGNWPPPPPPEPQPQLVLPPNVVLPPPPPPINQLDVPPPPAGPKFPADVPATAERLQKEMRSIAKLAKKDADDAEAFVQKWGTYFEMKERWAEFKAANLHLSDWYPDTATKFEKLTTALNILKAQFKELPDQKQWGIDGIAAAKALRMATLFQLRSDEWITDAAMRLDDIENDLALATSSASDVNRQLADLFSYTMAPPQPKGDDRAFRREVEQFEQQQSLKQKFIDDLKQKVQDWAIITQIAQIEPGYEKFVGQYETFASLVNSEQYDQAAVTLGQIAVSSSIATFIASTDQKKNELSIAFQGLKAAKSDDEVFTRLVNRISSMMEQLKAFTCIPSAGLIRELEPLFRQAIDILPQRWTADIRPLNSMIANPPDLTRQTKAQVDETLAHAVNTCIDFEKAFTDLTATGGDEEPDAGFKNALLKPTQELLAKYTPELLSTLEQRKEAREVLSTHQQVLVETRNRLLATAPLQAQPQLHADLLHEFIGAIESVLNLLSDDGVKAVTQQEELKARRKRLADDGRTKKLKGLVDSLMDPVMEIDRARKSKELATLLSKVDDVTCAAMVESVLDSDGLVSVLLQADADTAKKMIATIKARRGDDADYVDQLIERTIELDLRNTTDMASFMRDACPSVVLLSAFTSGTSEGKDFIQTTTQRMHQEIRELNLGDHGDPISMEIKLPDLQYRIKTAAKNRKENLDIPTEVPAQVVDKHREMMRGRISEITQRMPPQAVTRAMAALYEQTLKKFQALDVEFKDDKSPEEQALALVGGHVVLRMINPDLVSNMDEVMQRTRDQRVAAKIQSKMLQRISNMVTGESREKEFFAAFPDLVRDEHGNPSPEVVELQAYFRKIVYAGQAARGHAIPAPTFTNDFNVVAAEFQKAVGILNQNLQPLLLGKGTFKDSVSATNGLKAFASAFPFDLVSTLSSLAQAVNNNHPDVLKLMADVQAKAKSGIAALAKYDDVLWEAEGAFDQPVQLRGRMKTHCQHILAVATSEVQPAVRTVGIDDTEIAAIAGDQRLGQILAALGNAAGIPRQIPVVQKKIELLRSLVQQQDPGAAALAIELKTSLPRAVDAFTDYVNAKIDAISKRLQYVEAVSSDPALSQLRQRVNALRQMSPVEAWKLTSRGWNVKLEVDERYTTTATTQPAELFQAMTSVAAEFTSQSWRNFIQTLPQDLQDAHESVMNRIGDELETFETQRQNFTKNLLDSNAAAVTTECLQKLQHDLNSIRTNNDSFQTRLALMKKELRSYVTTYNDDIITRVSAKAIWNLPGGAEYLRSNARVDHADENTNFYGDSVTALAPRDNESLEDKANRLAVAIRKYYQEEEEPTKDNLYGTSAGCTVNVGYSANQKLKKAVQLLAAAQKADDNSREKQLQKAINVATRALELAQDDVAKNMNDVYHRRKAGLKMNLDFNDE